MNLYQNKNFKRKFLRYDFLAAVDSVFNLKNSDGRFWPKYHFAIYNADTRIFEEGENEERFMAVLEDGEF